MGSWIAYAVGYYGRVDVLEKHGKKLHIKKSHLEWADRWFERHGDATVFFTRMLPIIRTFISLPAGVARMPFWRFCVLTLAGCVPWVLMLTFIGQQAGDNWESWKDSLHYVDYVVAAAIVIGVIYLLVRRRGDRPAIRPAIRPPRAPRALDPTSSKSAMAVKPHRPYVGASPMSTAHSIAWGAETSAAGRRAAQSSGRSRQDPLDMLLEHLKAHPRVDAAAFMLVEPGRREGRDGGRLVSLADAARGARRRAGVAARPRAARPGGGVRGPRPAAVPPARRGLAGGAAAARARGEAAATRSWRRAHGRRCAPRR